MTIKKHVLASIIISLVIGLLIGVVLLALAGNLDVSFIIRWGLIITGIIVIISDIPSLIYGIMNIKTPRGIFDVISAILGIGLGCMMIFMQGTVITVIVSVYLVALPIVRVLFAENKMDCLKEEWVRILIGILLLVFLPALLNAADTIVYYVLLIAGWAAIVISVLSFLVSLISFIRHEKKANEGTIIVPPEEQENN